jgi:hypothetical protein
VNQICWGFDVTTAKMMISDIMIAKEKALALDNPRSRKAKEGRTGKRRD